MMSYGQVFNKTKMFYTVCGTETLFLKNPSDILYLDVQLEQDITPVLIEKIKQKYKSSDENCHLWQYELLPLTG